MSACRKSWSAGPGTFGPLLILAVLLTFYWPSVAGLAERWTGTASYGVGQHGSLLFAILILLVFRRWRLEGCPLAVRPRVGALLLLALLSATWALAGLGHIRVLLDLTFLLMLMPSLWLILGYRIGTRLGWPLLLLVTATEIWSVFIPLHREITTAGSVSVLNGLGISSLREGFVIVTSAGDFAVAQSCSGSQKVASAFAVTGLYAYLERLSLRGSAVLMLLGWLVAIASNVLRVMIVVVVGQATGMENPLIPDHEWLGWVTFGIPITALLMTVGRRLPQADAAAEAVAAVGVRARDLGSQSPGALGVFAAAVLVSLSVGPLLTTVAASNGAGVNPSVSPPLPEQVGTWRQSLEAETAWRPELVGADLERQALYRDPSGAEVSLYVATYTDQRQDKEAVFGGNRVYDGARWRDAKPPSRYRLAPDSPVTNVEETLLLGIDGRQRLVWRWYLVRGRTLSGDIEAKLASIVAALRGDRSAQVFVLSAPIQHGRGAARDTLAGFVRHLGEAMPASGLRTQ